MSQNAHQVWQKNTCSLCNSCLLSFWTFFLLWSPSSLESVLGNSLILLGTIHVCLMLCSWTQESRSHLDDTHGNKFCLHIELWSCVSGASSKSLRANWGTCQCDEYKVPPQTYSTHATVLPLMQIFKVSHLYLLQNGPELWSDQCLFLQRM